MISALVTPQTPRHWFHLFSMGPPRHSAHETWCFRFITRTKIPPFIFQRLGLHYIVIVSRNGSLSHLGHWCCTEIYDFCLSLVTLARKLSHRSIEQHKDTRLICFIYMLCLLLLMRPKWHGPVVTCSLYEVQRFTQGGVIKNIRRSPYFNSIIVIVIIIVIIIIIIILTHIMFGAILGIPLPLFAPIRSVQVGVTFQRQIVVTRCRERE